MKNNVLVFGGTTEGRLLSDYLREAGIPHKVSVATEYGREILLENGEDELLVGRKDFNEIRAIIESLEVSIVVDATHPFAMAASKEINKACLMAKVPYVRLKRNTNVAAADAPGVIYVDSMEGAAKEACDIEGNILVLTGSKELDKIRSAFSDTSRLFARVLPNEDSIAKCSSAGLLGKQIIAMQGPFSKQMNIATIKEIGAKAIITKESGKAGGFSEKLEAAIECGIKAIVVKNPENSSENPDSHSLLEVMEILSKHTGKEIHPVKNITLAGIGPGDEDFFTMELKKKLENADIIFGAQAVLKNLKKSEIHVEYEYSGEKIYKYLEEHPEYVSPIVLFSGDISLCSGAKKATEVFEDKGYRVNRVPGISSVALFSERLRLSLENVRVVSAHGKKCDVLRYALENEEIIVLPSDAEHAKEICERLKDSRMEITIGCNLGTKEERIISLKDAPEKKADISGKCLIYIKNATASGRSAVRSLSDDEIIRGDVPMTKEEIRTLSIRKLSLTKNAVFYDVGSGTGSISLEAALLSPDIKVYSIEKNEEAVELLSRNKEKFGVENIEIISGTAPEALEGLDAPSHVFIGGSSGSIKEIIVAVRQKNCDAKIVINTVTAETYAQVIDYVNANEDIEADIIEVMVNRFRKVGRYHLADALNPVYIITLKKGDRDDRN